MAKVKLTPEASDPVTEKIIAEVGPVVLGTETTTVELTPSPDVVPPIVPPPPPPVVTVDKGYVEKLEAQYNELQDQYQKLRSKYYDLEAQYEKLLPPEPKPTGPTHKRKFHVSIPHNPLVVDVEVELPVGTDELQWREQAVVEFYKKLGITKSTHQPQVRNHGEHDSTADSEYAGDEGRLRERSLE